MIPAAVKTLWEEASPHEIELDIEEAGYSKCERVIEALENQP